MPPGMARQKCRSENVENIRENKEHLVPGPFTWNNKDRKVRLFLLRFVREHFRRAEEKDIFSSRQKRENFRRQAGRLGRQGRAGKAGQAVQAGQAGQAKQAQNAHLAQIDMC